MEVPKKSLSFYHFYGTIANQIYSCLS